MKDYLAAAFAMLAATSQAIWLLDDGDVELTEPEEHTEITTLLGGVYKDEYRNDCATVKSGGGDNYEGYCYSPENAETTMPPNDCCWLYPGSNFKEDAIELCYKTRMAGTIKEYSQAVYKSVNAVLNDQFDDNIESWKCGAGAAVQSCENAAQKSRSTDKNPFVWDCIANGLLFTGGPSATNGQMDAGSQNTSSTFVIKPIDDCVPILTVYSGPSCTGNSAALMGNIQDSAGMQSIFTDDSMKIMSFTHKSGSTVNIYAEEQMTGHYVDFNSQVTDQMVCVTVAVEEDFGDFAKGDAIPQNSLSFTQQGCDTPL